MDLVFFIASKLAGAILRPDTWIVLALFVLVLALIWQCRRLALWVSGLTFVGVLSLAVLPLGALLLQPIERSYPPNPLLSRVDGVIVLGGGEDLRASVYWNQLQLNEGGDRYAAALSLARRFPAAQLLFVGGSGALRDLAGGAVSEASLAARLFRDQGIHPARLLLEERSRNTAENAELSLTLADPSAGETWVLVTSAFHMPRAMRSFERAGWLGLVPWPVDYRTAGFIDGFGWDLTRNLQTLNTAIRAHVGQLVYRLTGR